MPRIIGIRHRIKFTREQEPRPTEVAIRVEGKDKITYKLETEDDEIDFVTCRFPTKFRKIEPDEDISSFLARHVKWKKIKKDEVIGERHASQLLLEKKQKLVTQVLEGTEGGKMMWHKVRPDEDVTAFLGDSDRVKTRNIKPGEDLSERHTSQIFVVEVGEPTHYASEVPVKYDGLKPGDSVAMTLGGSGDPLAFALSRHAEMLTTESGTPTGVYRVPPAAFKEFRAKRQEGTSKENDHLLLVELFEEDSNLFYLTGPADRDRIEVTQLLRNRATSQADRKAAFQRFESRLIGRIFMQEDFYPELSVRDMIAAEREANEVLQTLLTDEDERTKELSKKVKELDVYKALFEPIKGVGPVLAASLIVAIGDPRRFEVKPDPEEYERIRLERNALTKDGRYEEDKEAAYTWLRNSTAALEREGKYKDFIKSQNFPSNLPYYMKLDAVSKYKAFTHKDEEAEQLKTAAALTKRLGKMQRDARNKSFAKMRAFCGVHVMKGGKYEDVPFEKQFPRRRSGQVCNWSPLARQALYLLADQFNRRPDSEWGLKFREEKRLLREEKHPEVLTINGKKRYTDGHLHKMAIWKTLSKFVRWLYINWMKLETRSQPVQLTDAA